MGGLFETLVLAEIIKFIRNYGKDWELFFWRTKDGQEIDFIIKTTPGSLCVIEAKYAIHGISQAIHLPPAFQKEFDPKTPLAIVTSGGQKLQLSSNCITIPITELHDYLQGI
jgi:predicted AAA+ superfamily ATPase